MHDTTALPPHVAAPPQVSARPEGTAGRIHAAAPRLASWVAVASFVAWLLLPADVVIDWTDENGPVEDLTILLYLLGAVAIAIVATGRRLPLRTGTALGLTMLAFAAREADWHVLFTGTSMLRVSYYLGPAAWTHKLASLAVMGVLAACWLHLALAAQRTWRGDRARRDGLWANVAAFLCVLVLSKVLDRMLSVAAEDFGLATSSAMRALQLALEEPLEMALPLMVLVTLWQHLAGRSAALRRDTRGQPAIVERTAAEASPASMLPSGRV